MRKALYFITIILSGFLSSCAEAPLYEKVYSFEGREWKQNIKLDYVVNIENIKVEYNFTLSLRTSTDYKYNNLWIFMKTEAPDGSVSREPFEILIANPDGSWIGHNTGSVVETPLNFKKRKLPLKGEYKFTVEQAITESKVDEVLDLGFKVDTEQEAD